MTCKMPRYVASASSFERDKTYSTPRVRVKVKVRVKVRVMVRVRVRGYG